MQNPVPRSVADIRDALHATRDEAYRAFQCPLMPTVNPETVIGVRTPILRRMAKEWQGSTAATALLADLPHAYFEENQLHAFLLEPIRDFDAALAAVDAFLPYVDNWATCDQLSPRAFAPRRAERFADLKSSIDRWMASEHTYTVRFGIGMLMRYGLDEHFSPDHLAAVAAPSILAREDYYIRMMVAWFFATALAKQYDTTLPYIRDRRLPVWTHRMTIRKACESFRVSDAHKATLRGMR